MASAHWEVGWTVVTGLRRRDAMVAPWKESGLVMEELRRCWVVGVRGGVGGRRSLAASQSSSTNYLVLAWIFG